MASGTVRPYTLVDVLRTIYGAATGSNATNDQGVPTPISLVGEADEQLTLADLVSAVSEVPGGWDTEIWGLSWN